MPRQVPPSFARSRHLPRRAPVTDPARARTARGQ